LIKVAPLCDDAVIWTVSPGMILCKERITAGSINQRILIYLSVGKIWCY